MKGFKDLTRRIEEQIRLAKEEAPLMRQLVNQLIAEKSNSMGEIETLLDMLLTYVQMGYCSQEFKKLNKYYSVISKENAEEYEKFYNEIFRD